MPMIEIVRIAKDKMNISPKLPPVAEYSFRLTVSSISGVFSVSNAAWLVEHCTAAADRLVSFTLTRTSPLFTSEMKALLI